MKRSTGLSWAGILLCVIVLTLALVSCPPSVTPPATPQQYSLIMLDDREGWAYGLNEQCEVVGRLHFMGGWHAFLWRPDTSPKTVDLGDLGGNSSTGYAINEYSQVAGDGAIPNLFPHAVLWKPGMAISDLGTLGGNVSTGYSINNAGLVAGDSGDPEGFYRAMTWTPEDGMQQIAGAERGTHAFGVNNSGVTAGSLRDGNALSTLAPPEARVWDAAGSAIPITNAFGGNASMAYGINDVGEVVGFAQHGKGAHVAFRWTESGGMKDLGSLGHFDGFNFYSNARDINFWGDIVGFATWSDGRHHAVLWEDGQITDLNDLMPPGTDFAYLANARSINNKGCIAGTGVRRVDGREQDAPFLLIPVILESLKLYPPTVTGGKSVDAIVRLNAEAPMQIDVEIDYSDVSNLVGPSVNKVIIPKGEQEKAFHFTTKKVARSESGEVVAKFGGRSVSATLTVQ